MRKYLFLPVLVIAAIGVFYFWGSEESQQPQQVQQPKTAAKAQEPRPREAGNGSVIGKVIHADSGLPAIGATVQLAAAGAVLLETKTDQDGAFGFKSVPGGAWKLMAHAPGLISFANAGDIPILTIDRQISHHGPLQLELQKARSLQVQVISAETKRVLDRAVVRLAELKQSYTTDNTGLTLLHLAPGIWNAAISAPDHLDQSLRISLRAGEISSQTVALKPAGLGHFSVADSAGNPIPGVNFTVTANDMPTRIYTADQSGHMELSQLPLDRRFRLTLSEENFETTRADLAFEDGKRIIERHFTMKPLPPELQLAGGRYMISGTIVNRNSDPVAGATVRHMGQLFETKSSGDGSFRLGPFKPDGRFASILITAPDLSGEIVDVDLGGSERWVRLGEIPLDSARIFSGRVVDNDGYPVSGATLSMEVVRKLSHRDFMPTPIDADGFFRLEGIPRGAMLSFRAPAHFGKDLNYGAIPFGSEDHEIMLRRWPQLNAVVIDRQTREPLEKFWFQAGADARETLVHSKDGEFGHQPHFQNPKSLSVLRQALDIFMEVSIRAEGYVPNRFKVSMDQLGGEDPVVFEMSKGRPLGGFVVWEPGRPASNIRVAVMTLEDFRKNPLDLEDHRKASRGENPWPANISRVSTSDEDGRLYFESVPTGYNLIAVGFGAEIGMRHLLVHPEDRFFRMFVSLPVQIDAIIDRQSFPGLAEVQISWSQDPGKARPDAPLPPTSTQPVALPTINRNFSLVPQPDQDRVSLGGLPAGDFRITLYHPNQSGKQQSVDWKFVQAAPGEHPEVRLGFDMATLSGTVYVDGEVAPDAFLYLFPKDNNGIWRPAVSDSEGHFSFTKLAAGVWTLALRGSDSPDNEGFFLPIHAGNAAGVMLEGDVRRDFSFEKFSNVSGKVVGAPAESSLFVTWRGEGHVGAPARINGDGSFLLQSLAPGVLQISLLQGSERPLMLAENIEIPSDGSDLDLGELSLPQTGSLKVSIDYPDHAGGHQIEVQAHHLTTGRRLFIDQIRGIDGDQFYNELKTGRIRLTLEAKNCIMDPAAIELDILPDQMTEHRASITEQTGLIFTFPGHTIKEVFLEGPGARDLTLTEVEPILLGYYPAAYGGDRGHIYGIQPGVYQVVLIDEMGETGYASVEVLPDRHNRITITEDLEQQ